MRCHTVVDKKNLWPVHWSSKRVDFNLRIKLKKFFRSI